jgi:hypothetical protein
MWNRGESALLRHRCQDENYCTAEEDSRTAKLQMPRRAAQAGQRQDFCRERADYARSTNEVIPTSGLMKLPNSANDNGNGIVFPTRSEREAIGSQERGESALGCRS